MKNKLNFKLILLLGFFVLSLVLSGVIVYSTISKDPPLEEKFALENREPAAQLVSNAENNESIFNKETPENTQKKQIPNESIPDTVFNIPQKYEISKNSHVYQTFNNCGPATLSMALSYYGINVGQDELGNKMRPYQNPQGDNDDKTIFTHEFVDWAVYYAQNQQSGKNVNAINLPNGDIELLKLFISNDIPVIAKTWLNKNEDIGHFVLIRGYDDVNNTLIKDDSYYGPDKRVSYYDFMSLWQVFNFSYIVIYDETQKPIVNAILGDEINETVAWQKAADRALKEKDLDPQNIYPVFNLSVAYFHLGDYGNSTKYFELVESRLSRRMLWYQIEPIKSYIKLEKTDRALQIIEDILNNGNRAFSELYYLRGQIYLEQGSVDKAKNEFETALKYNQNYEEARDVLNTL